MIPIGYLNNTEEGLAGEPGLFYDYILAGNGLFIRAENPLLRATVQIAGADVRGLVPIMEKVELRKGKIPWYIYGLALSTFLADRSRESYIAVTWEEGYRFRTPPQIADGCSVRYERLPSTVLDFHSHGIIEAFFSTTDNEDEQGLCLFMVAGELDRLVPGLKLRIGVYGYFRPVKLYEVFDV